MAAIAAGRLGIGVIATVRPGLAARSWVDRPSADGTAALVFARALGGRDIALAAGALAAFRAHDQAELRRWAGMGAIADAVDAVATLACWSALPKTNRLLVLAAAAGAAVVGGAAVTGGAASRTVNGPTPTLELEFWHERTNPNSNVGVGARPDGRAPLSRKLAGVSAPISWGRHRLQGWPLIFGVER